MTAPAESRPPWGTELRRVVAASVVGTALEWYDFFIYGTAAALVFRDVFFPSGDPATGTLLGFATFGVGFAFRPIGGFVFGHLGDRIGRRSTLIITTLVMGLSTGLIGVLPTYATAGVVAPVLLTLLRICQGLGAGAEFGGAATLLTEHAPGNRRGFFASFAQTGVQIGLVCGTLAFLLVGLLPNGTVQAWAWRLPFLVSFAMIAVSLYVRLRVTESPVFERMERSRRIVRMPILDALRRYPRNFLVGVGAHICDTAAVYLYATFAVAYITDNLGLPSWVALTGVIVFDVFVIVTQPLFGALSDRVGRRPVNLFSVAFTGAFAYPFFLLVNTAQPVLIWLALVVAAVVGWAPMIAVQPAFYAELFGAKVRYTGFAASRELGAAIAGFSPLVASVLLRQSAGPWLVPLVLVVAAVVGLVAFLYSRESRHVDVTAYDLQEGTPQEGTMGLRPTATG